MQLAAFVVNAAAGVTFILVGIALLLLRPPRAGIVGFAAYAVLAGAQQLLVNLGSQLASRTLLAIGWAFLAVAPLALVAAVTSYRAASWLWLAPFAATGTAGAVMFVLRPASMLQPGGGFDTWGLILWQFPAFASLAVAILRLERARADAPSPELHREAVLLLLALAPYLAYTSAVSSAFILGAGFHVTEPSWGLPGLATFGACFAIVILSSAQQWRSGRRSARALAGLSVAVGLFGFLQATAVPGLLLFGGILRILAALLLGYGLLKYGLFDVDVRLKWTLDRGTILAIFGGVFFLVEQVAEFYVSAVFGAFAGFAAAGLLLVALKPMRKWTARLADGVFPHVRPTRDYADERKVIVYRAAAQTAGRDGVLTPKVRAMLDALVRELQIPPADVARVEKEAFSGALA